MISSYVFSCNFMIQNQTRVCSPTHNPANLWTPGCGEEKCSIYVRCHTRSPGQLVLKKQNSPVVLGKHHVISSCTVLSLVDGEVAGRGRRGQHHQSLGARKPGASLSWSSSSVRVLASVKHLRKCASECYLSA